MVFLDGFVGYVRKRRKERWCIKRTTNEALKRAFKWEPLDKRTAGSYVWHDKAFVLELLVDVCNIWRCPLYRLTRGRLIIRLYLRLWSCCGLLILFLSVLRLEGLGQCAGHDGSFLSFDVLWILLPSFTNIWYRSFFENFDHSSYLKI